MNFLKTLFVIALPIILQNFFSSFVNMLDTIMVGQLGSIDIAAVGLANQIFFVLNIVLFGTVSGGSIFMTQFWGKKDIQGIHRTMGITLIMSFFVSLVFFSVAFFAPGFCLSLYTKDYEVIKRGAEYLRCVAPSYFFFGIGFAFAHAERSIERVKIPMVATTTSVLINAVLNYFLIFGIKIGGNQIIPAMGIIGAAIATNIARFIEFLILIIIPYARHYEIAAKFSQYFKSQPGFLAKYVRICLPVLINESLWGIGQSIQNSIYAHAGTDIIAAFNIQSTISNLIWTFFIGCGNACAIIIGKKIGEGMYDEAKKLAKKITFFMIGCATCAGIFLFPLSMCLKYFFKVEPEVIHMAQVFLWIAICLYPLWSIGMSMVVGVCRSGGDTIFALIIDVGFMWMVSLPLGFCAVYFWHLPFWAIYLCVHTEDFLKATFGLIRLFSGKWLKNVTE